MLRKTFETEIQQLKDEIILLGSLVEQNLLDSVDAMKKRDTAASQRVIALDKQINDKRFALEN